ncbi:hypothetical protein [Actinokineospora bangkokensis]|uniref:PPE family domain-containing protein n=1 Tax=Actinokineospora bangkokensis TaxID=1193682 RepID=A0A1Q9LR15_9PSEU|nr:hypothetical protein [Actinokineospora bangkokensis]OLR94431.1 hypothetical protein BJP25_11785 [Actinokineospora bangkokensis]
MNDGVNWDAHTHEELHRMIWEQADVGATSDLAARWRAHSTDLATRAAALRAERDELATWWSGESADLATARLDELAERVDGIAERAAAHAAVAEQAAEALAQVRATLPPPPTAAIPTAALPTQTTAFQQALAAQAAQTQAQNAAFQQALLQQWTGQPVSTDQFASLLRAPAPTPPSPPRSGFYLWFGVAPNPGPVSALGTVAAAQTSMFAADAAATQAKAQAVAAMRTYEDALRSGESRVSTPGVERRGGAAPNPARVPEARADSEPKPVAPRAADRGGQLAAREPVVREPAQPRQVTESTTRSAAAPNQSNGLHAAGQRAAKTEDTEHQNRMPHLDHGLFAVREAVSVPVIGALEQPGATS